MSDDKNILEMDPSYGIENFNENTLESNLRHVIASQEKDILKKKRIAKAINIFDIVVSNLEKKGYFLPNNDINSIRRMFAGKIYIVVHFDGNVSLTFDPDSVWTMSSINGESQILDEYYSNIYRKKYLEYAKLFLEEKDNISDNGTNLAVEKLSRLGI